MVRKNNNKILLKMIFAGVLLANVLIGVNLKATTKLSNNSLNKVEQEYNIPEEKVVEIPELEFVKDTFYTVKAGDTLSEIVHYQYGKYDYHLLMALGKYNAIKDLNKIYVGDIIAIPSSEVLYAMDISDMKAPTPIAKKTETKKTTVKSNVDLSKVQKDIADIKKDVDYIKQDVSSLEASVDSLQAQANTDTDNIKGNTNELNSLNKKFRELEKDFGNEHNSIDDIWQKLNDIQRSLDELDGIKKDIEELNGKKNKYLEKDLGNIVEGPRSFSSRSRTSYGPDGVSYDSETIIKNTYFR